MPRRASRRSNLVWLAGIAAGLVAGGLVAYGVACQPLSAARSHR